MHVKNVFKNEFLSHPSWKHLKIGVIVVFEILNQNHNSLFVQVSTLSPHDVILRHFAKNIYNL